jgi:hypothetical protein
MNSCHSQDCLLIQARTFLTHWCTYLALCMMQEHFSDDAVQQIAKLATAANAPVFMTGTRCLRRPQPPFAASPPLVPGSTAAVQQRRCRSEPRE